MSSQANKAKKSVEVALENALYRLTELKGRDRVAFANEYKEWLINEDLNEQVWFSINA